MLTTQFVFGGYSACYQKHTIHTSAHGYAWIAVLIIKLNKDARLWNVRACLCLA